MSRKEHSKKHPLSEDGRKRLIKSKKGKPRSNKTKQKISKTLTGRKLPKEVIEKISKTKTGKPLSNYHQKQISKSKNSTGYFRVNKIKKKNVRQGFVYSYQYYVNGRQRLIQSVSLTRLEKKVRKMGLEWFKLED